MEAVHRPQSNACPGRRISVFPGTLSLGSVSPEDRLAERPFAHPALAGVRIQCEAQLELEAREGI